jgi:hypothetical protein
VQRNAWNIWPGAPQLYSRASSLVPRHAAGQGINRYTAYEGDFQEVDRVWVTSLGDAACLDQLHVWRVVDRGAGRFAEADPCVRVYRHCPASRWTVR